MNLKPGSLGESQVEWQQNTEWTSQIHRTALTSHLQLTTKRQMKVINIVFLNRMGVKNPKHRRDARCAFTFQLLPFYWSAQQPEYPGVVQPTCHPQCHEHAVFSSRSSPKFPCWRPGRLSLRLSLYLYEIAKNPEPTTPNQSSWSFTLVFFHPNRIPESHQPASTEQMHDGTSVSCHEKPKFEVVFVLRQNVLFIQSIQMLSWTLDWKSIKWSNEMTSRKFASGNLFNV